MPTAARTVLSQGLSASDRVRRSRLQQTAAERDRLQAELAESEKAHQKKSSTSSVR